MAERFKARVRGRLLAVTAGSNPAEGTDVFLVSVVLSGRGLCDGPITRSVESYRLRLVNVHGVETSRVRRPWPVLGCSART